MKKTFQFQEDYKTVFGKALCRMRSALALDQASLARAVSAGNVNVVSRLENGQAISIKLNHLAAFIRYAMSRRYPVHELLGFPTLLESHGRDALVRALANIWIEEHGAKKEPAEIFAAGVVASAIQVQRQINALHHVLSTRPETVRYAVEETADFGYKLIDAEDVTEDWRGRMVPVIGRIAAGVDLAGDTTFAGQMPVGWADAFVEYPAAPPRAFAVTVVGDSMMPKYHPHDVLIVDGSRLADSGVCCAIYQRGGERVARLKRLRRAGKKVILESTNPAVEPMEFPAFSVQAFAVIGHLPFIRRSRPRKEG